MFGGVGGFFGPYSQHDAWVQNQQCRDDRYFEDRLSQHAAAARAQQAYGGLAGLGAWGGMALSDIDAKPPETYAGKITVKPGHIIEYMHTDYILTNRGHVTALSIRRKVKTDFTWFQRLWCWWNDVAIEDLV